MYSHTGGAKLDLGPIFTVAYDIVEKWLDN